MSDDTPAAPWAESFEILKQKNPQASLRAADLPCPSQNHCLSVDESKVRRAVLLFPAGSARGPDGLRLQHIRDMLLCREGRSEFLTDLTAFVNMTLSGHCPSDVAPVFLAVAVWRHSSDSDRLYSAATVSKCTNTHGVNHLKSFLKPRQLGVGTPGGCEAAIYAARRYLESLLSNHVMVKLDFANAFNSLHRHDMLTSMFS